MNDLTRTLAFTFSLPAALLIASPGLRAQAAAESHAHQKHAQMGEGSHQMMEECQAMMAERAEMMSEMRSAEAKLDELVNEMNAAQGNAKVEALARVVKEMAEQRKKTMGTMMALEPRMMQHMMQHMRMGMMEGNEQAMECPMMKEMMRSPKKKPGTSH